MAVVAGGDDPPNWLRTEFGPALRAAARAVRPAERPSILGARDDAITYVPVGPDDLLGPPHGAVALVTVEAGGAAYRPRFRLGHADASERAGRDARPLRQADSSLVADTHLAHVDGDPGRREAALLDLRYSPLGQDLLLDRARLQGGSPPRARDPPSPGGARRLRRARRRTRAVRQRLRQRSSSFPGVSRAKSNALRPYIHKFCIHIGRSSTDPHVNVRFSSQR